MKYLDNLYKIDFKNSCVTLGKFDGVHMGHALLLNEIKEREKEGLTSVVVTFSSYPGINFVKGSQELIYTNDEKPELIATFEPNYLVDIPFTDIIKNMPAEMFLEDILVRRMGVKAIIIGDDFKFGRERRGDKDFLIANAEKYGYEVKVFEKLKLETGEEVSSTNIRKLISEGNITLANKMLNRNFHVAGQLTTDIVKGTETVAKLKPHKVKLLPADGSYKVIVKRGKFSGNGILDVNGRELILRPENDTWQNSYYNYEIIKIEFRG